MNELENKQDGYIKDDSFMVFCPVELLEKSSKDEDPYRDCHIKGIASTEDRDLQSEILKSNGLNISALNEGKGIFNYDHKEGPENVIGKVEEADITDQGLQVQGYLFKDHDRGKAFLQILKSLKPKDKHRVQMSVEGKILERSGIDSKVITKANITKVALTLDPVNPKTYTELVKSFLGNTITGNPDGISKDFKKEEDLINVKEARIKKRKEEEAKEEKVNKSENDSESVDDVVSCNSSLLIRLLEWAKEDANEDVDLHKAIERALKMSNGDKTLKMDDYSKIVGASEKEGDSGGEILEKEKMDKSNKADNNSEYLVKKLDETLRTLIKTLGVGNAYTTAPTDMVGGAALTKESLIGSGKRKRKHKKKHKKKELNKSADYIVNKRGVTQETVDADAASYRAKVAKETGSKTALIKEKKIKHNKSI